MLKTGIKFAAVLLALSGCLRAQSPFPDPDGAAKLLNFTGRLSVIRASCNCEWALNTGDIISRQETVVTGPDGWGLFQVADGSKFEVYPNSKVVFRANQGDWRDLLEVWLGKVRVQIEHFGGQPNNNKVRTPTAVISVRGTIFIVEVDAQNRSTLVQDEEGVVVVRHTLRPSEKILNTGEYVWVYENQPIAKATFDKSGIMQKLARAAEDALYQASANGHGSVVHGAGSGSGLPADSNHAPTTSGSNTGGANSGGATAPPPPAPPPPPPPQFLPAGTTGATPDSRPDVPAVIDWSGCPAVERAPASAGGEWVLRGTLIPVTAVLESLGDGGGIDAFLERFPGLDRAQVTAVADFAARSRDKRR
jgi:uncharacterized protein (DUF433 family)